VQPEYVLWNTFRPPYVCSLGNLDGVEKVFELKDGVPRAAGFSEHARFQMSTIYPYDIRLADCLKNTDRLIVASEALKEFLESHALDHVEYLPVTILNHKERVASREYYIIHLISPVDCLDVPKCGATRSSLVPEDILDLNELVLDPSRIDPDRRIFRLKYYERPVLARRDLAAALESRGFSGLSFAELTEYPKYK